MGEKVDRRVPCCFKQRSPTHQERPCFVLADSAANKIIVIATEDN